jgi:hypothetical protein
MKSKPATLAGALLTATATVSLAFAGTLSASAGGAYAPPATTMSDLSFVVPLTVDPAQTRVDVGGQLEDQYLTDNLADFTITITCPDIAPVNVAITPRGVNPDIHFGTVLFGETGAWLPKSEEGKTCSIHSTSPSVNRALVFSAPSTKPGETGDTSRLYFSGSVIFKVTSRGGAY